MVFHIILIIVPLVHLKLTIVHASAVIHIARICPLGKYISRVVFIMFWHRNSVHFSHRTRTVNIYVLIQIDLFIMLLSIVKSRTCVHPILSVYLKSRAFFSLGYVAVAIAIALFTSCYFLVLVAYFNFFSHSLSPALTL